MLFTVDPKTFILIYLCLFTGSALLYWAISHLFFPRKKVTLEGDHLTQCTTCLSHYISKESKGPTKCPICHSYG